VNPPKSKRKEKQEKPYPTTGSGILTLIPFRYGDADSLNVFPPSHIEPKEENISPEERHSPPPTPHSTRGKEIERRATHAFNTEFPYL
jgi:hypothetical protein